MRPVHNATLAFLFTDIEGSTRLWERLPGPMAHAVARHDALVRAAVEASGGQPFKSTGDGSCHVFGDARDAIAAAVVAQRALYDEPWGRIDPDLERIRVRMAVHVGPAVARDGDYFGPTLNQTARLLALGHGGQILVSLVTQQLVRGRLDDGVELVDHGHHSLRDVRFAEHVFEVVVPGLPREQRPLRDDADAPPPAEVTGEPEADIDHWVARIRTSTGDAVLGDVAARALARQSPQNITAYRLSRVAEWSQPQYQLDRRFVSLSLLVDLGETAPRLRWLAEPERFDDLAAILDRNDSPAVVVLGAPGSGKSTLLRHLELTLCLRALRDASEAVTWFVPLNLFRLGIAEPPTADAIAGWLDARWRSRYPALPPLAELRRQGRLVLILDGLNEIPHTDAAAYRRLVGAWRQFIVEHVASWAGNRAVFSCRNLDYSAPLSSVDLRVPQVVIEAFDPEQIREFLERYSPHHADRLWSALSATAHIEALCTPYLLRMLVDQVEMTGEAPRGPAALFTGFVRLALEREILNENVLLGPNDRLTEREHRQIIQGGPWESAYALPERGRLMPTLSRLAHDIHARTADAESSQVVVEPETAEALLDCPDAASILQIAEDLGIIVEQTGGEGLSFVHQLLQEYFAARHFVRAPDFDVTRTAWRAAEVAVPLPATLAALAPADPLPPLPGSRWDEVIVMAAPIARRPDAFLAEVSARNLTLAGRCLVSGEIEVAPETRRAVVAGLRDRARDPAADLRARIDAARLFGDLGGPDGGRRTGPHGACIAPQMRALPGGAFRVGRDAVPAGSALPPHDVVLAPYALGRFPVTNAEYACFMAAGGYDDPRWWVSAAAQAWRRGEDTGLPARLRELRIYRQFESDPGLLDRLNAQGYLVPAFFDRWTAWSRLDGPAFAAVLAQHFPDHVIDRPHRWHDPAFRSLCQPVVGVSAFEAEAYCAWLSAQLGQSMRLPLATEWEAAAAGVEQRAYAWGDAFDPLRCNTLETHVRSLTPVGVFPDGATPDGIEDMCGNTFEWCVQAGAASAAPEAGDVTLDARPAYAVRGGSWNADATVAYTWYQALELPGSQGDNSGFRLASPRA